MVSSMTDITTAPLKASRRIASGMLVFPEIPAGSPSAKFYETVTLSPEATLYSFTVLHGVAKEPMILAYADFSEGARAIGRLDMPAGKKPEIGMALRAVVDSEDGGEALLAYHFEPAEARA